MSVCLVQTTSTTSRLRKFGNFVVTCGNPNHALQVSAPPFVDCLLTALRDHWVGCHNPCAIRSRISKQGLKEEKSNKRHGRVNQTHSGSGRTQPPENVGPSRAPLDRAGSMLACCKFRTAEAHVQQKSILNVIIEVELLLLCDAGLLFSFRAKTM